MIAASAFLGVLMAPASASLAMIVTPIAESATRITTDLTLLELSDLGRPLLRRLALEAPGTWAHSLAMANLCESACNIIGANGLLARVGCYYHDVGKLANPRFFMENQGGGPNPHDELSPTESARIIRNHVLDGIALAEDAGLPEVVKAFIPEHHGTTEITYFLSRARLLASDGRVNPADFRYPGPRPQSAETAVAMLADSAEAVVRVLDDRRPELVREAIEQLVAQKLSSGQLDEAPLSLVDLDRIKREFARVMSGTYHKRIGYPRAAAALRRSSRPPSVREVVVSGRRLPLPSALVRRVVEAVLEGERRPALVSVTFLGRDAMRRMNATHKGRDLPTDVLAFAMTDGAGRTVGDVYVCPWVAAREAKARGVPLREELVRLVIHGTLHALGRTHPEGRRARGPAMWRRQERYVGALA